MMNQLYKCLALLGVGHLLFPFISFGEELRDVKPPVEYPSSVPVFLIILVVIIFILIGYIYFLKNRKNILMDSKEIGVFPWEKALSELHQLAQSGLLEQEKFNEFYVKLSEIIRCYLEERFQLRAPEMTTEEFLSHLKNTAELSGNQKDTLKEFMIQSDLVKFAKHKPNVMDAKEHLKIARLLVEQTKKNEDNLNHGI